MFETNKILKLVSFLFVGTALLYASKNMFLSRAGDIKLAYELTLPAMDFDDSMQIKQYQQLLKHPTMEKL